ncbi:MAG TPA: methyl-accepting chemotaxis protein [Blastocatellia bacterium]|nr:methyl-accepting chemotaxis protein [Blastocatellia bacterium]
MSISRDQNRTQQGGLFGWLSASITAKVMVAMAFVTVAPLLLTGIFINRSTATELREKTGSQTREAAMKAMDMVTQTLADNIHMLEALSTSVEMRNALAAANNAHTGTPEEVLTQMVELDKQWVGQSASSPLVQKVTSDDPAVNPVASQLHKFRKQFPRHAEVFITDKHGANIAATNQTSDYYQGDEGWWRAASKGAVYVGKPTLDTSAGIKGLIIAVPIKSNSDEVIGVARTTFDMQVFTDILASVKPGGSSRLVVADPDGLILFDPSRPTGDDHKLPGSAIFAEILSHQGSGWLESKGFNEENAIIGYAKPSRDFGVKELKSLGWTTVATINSLEALASIGRATQYQVIIGVLAALLAIAVAFLLTRRLTSQLNHIADLFEQIRRGDYMARAPVVSNDELGEMTQNLNTVLDETLVLIQSREERDKMQRAVMKLLEEVSGAAAGDLTGQAEVTADATGAIADAFNYMIVELRGIVSRVQDVTLAVTSTASQTQQSTESLAQDSENQARQILGAREAIEEMAQSIQQVSENAVRSAEVAQQSLANARQGAEAVQNTIRGMNSIREQVQETAKRIKRLGESSQEIGEVVQLISDIAYRTNVLALNASIQAAMADDEGRGFAVVAEEVQRLAKRASEATKRIGGLVKAIQLGANEAIAAMEESTREVVEGSHLANQAGQALQAIETVSMRLAELNQAMSLAAKQQAAGSQAVSRSMVQISEFTQLTAAGIKKSAMSVNDLAGLANQLRASVASFKLPEGNGHNQAMLN